MHQSREYGKEVSRPAGIKDTKNKTTKYQDIKLIKRNNKVTQALNLPSICNLNPRSIYNKRKEFETLVEQEELDLIFMSESWERITMTLDQAIHLEKHTVISNVHQRIGTGGRPAIFANHEKFDVENITNTLVQIPWGVEAVWCILTPKLVTNDSKIHKIACCAVYSKPNSRKKSLLLDHISDAFNILKKKNDRGLEFIIAGDTNDLKLDSILNLDSHFVQIVQEWTRMDPPSILDPIIMTLSKCYQEPVCMDPLDSDSDQNGTKSDHRLVIARPISAINNKAIRRIRKVEVRPFPQSGMDLFKDWLMDQSWQQVYDAQSAHSKAQIFQEILITKLDEIFPLKTRNISSDDQPWVTYKLKKLDRKRKRVFHKERKSEKWKILDKIFEKASKCAKSDFYKKKVAELKQKNPSQWYSCLKNITSFDQHKREQTNVEEIRHLPDQEQAELIAAQFAKIQNEYEPLQNGDISVPYFSEEEIPRFTPAQVWFGLTKLRANKATVPGDVPAKLLKYFAAYLAEPLTDILNTSVRRGEYPKIYKFETSTPVPKVHPTKNLSQLRNISGLFNFDKVFEKLLAELIISDMSAKLDPAQFGNQRGMSIQHYLIKMVNRILQVLDSSSKSEAVAVIANLIDWNNAFPRQCPKLGIESFIRNGVRPALIPVLVNYFQDREMSVKWHGCKSVPVKINGGGPQGATLGILEYLSQSNTNADLVSVHDRFKFVDDLTVLEIVNLLTVGITSYNIRQHIPTDIPVHNQFIPPDNLMSQKWLDEINTWTKNQKMLINENKTKNMIFNFTKNHQFSTRLELNGEKIETLKKTKLLGTVLTNDLKWEENTKCIIRKANTWLELFRRGSVFSRSDEDIKSYTFFY